MKDPNDVAALRERLRSEGADFGNFDLVTSGFIGDDPSPWAKAGVDWFLSWIGPYHMNFDEVHEIIKEGPRAVDP
jgi:hypothetical protein